MKTGFADYVVNDLLAGMGDIRVRAMFGGHAVYKGDTVFAIIADDELYYKVDASNRQDFVSHGSQPFVYDRPQSKKSVTMSYWKLPASVMDDRQALEEWTLKAVRVSEAHKKNSDRF